MEYEILKMSTTDAAANTDATRPGWLSGTIASLAASGSTTVQFDLGPNWMWYPYIRLLLDWRANSTGGTVQVYGGDTAGATTRRLGFIDSDSISASFITLASANGPQTADLRPMGRYVTVSAVNSDATNAVGSGSRIDLFAYSR